MLRHTCPVGPSAVPRRQAMGRSVPNADPARSEADDMTLTRLRELLESTGAVPSEVAPVFVGGGDWARR